MSHEEHMTMYMYFHTCHMQSYRSFQKSTMVRVQLLTESTQKIMCMREVKIGVARFLCVSMLHNIVWY